MYKNDIFAHKLVEALSLFSFTRHVIYITGPK